VVVAEPEDLALPWLFDNGVIRIAVIRHDTKPPLRDAQTRRTVPPRCAPILSARP
jgi:hypothetical protein